MTPHLMNTTLDLLDHRKAEAAFHEAREAYLALYGQRSRGLAASTLGLALVSLKRGQYAEAEKTARSALEISGQVFARNDPVRAHSLNVLAAALEAEDRLKEAEDACRDAIAIGRTHAAREALMLGKSLSVLGRVLSKQKRLAEAKTVLSEALEVHRRVLGNDHPEVAELSKVLAGVLEEQGRAEAGQSVSNEVKRILQTPTDPPSK